MPTPPSPKPQTTESRLTNRVTPPDAPGLSGLLSLAVGVVIIAALSVAREVLIPITLAVLLSFVLGPVVAILRRIGLPRAISVVVAVITALSVVVVIGGVIGTQVAQLVDDLPRYATTVEQKVSQASGFATKQLSTLTSGLDKMSQQQKPAESGAEAKPDAGPKPLVVEVRQPAPKPLELAQTLLLPVISPLATAAIVFVVAIFILLQREDLRDRIIRLFGSNDLHRTTAALDDAGSRLGRYYLSLLAVNTAFGAVIGAGLFFIGVPSPVLWGIVAGLLRFIPYVGAVGGAVFPILLAAAVDPGWTLVFETIALFLVIEPVLGQVIEPLIYGHSTGLSPVSVVISAIFWGWIWGGIGLLLSMPLTLCLVVLGKHIQRLQFLDVLLGDQPALSPAEGLYQRMLVGDADEALEQAETLLKERSLATYYDEVAVPGLQLAANDSLRGVLTEEQLRGILETISGVVVDLADEGNAKGKGGSEKGKEGGEKGAEDGDEPGDDADPALPSDTEAASVLCVAGRGPLDEAICGMLAQLLGKRGLRAQVVSHHAVTRSKIQQLDLGGAQLICVSYIEGMNSLSPLRYLVRRLRQRAHSAEILVGLWAADIDMLDVERVQAAIGADQHVRSLQAAVDACVERVHATSADSNVAIGIAPERERAGVQASRSVAETP